MKWQYWARKWITFEQNYSTCHLLRCNFQRVNAFLHRGSTKHRGSLSSPFTCTFSAHYTSTKRRFLLLFSWLVIWWWIFPVRSWNAQRNLKWRESNSTQFSYLQLSSRCRNLDAHRALSSFFFSLRQFSRCFCLSHLLFHFMINFMCIL